MVLIFLNTGILAAGFEMTAILGTDFWYYFSLLSGCFISLLLLPFLIENASDILLGMATGIPRQNGYLGIGNWPLKMKVDWRCGLIASYTCQIGQDQNHK